ncbi:MAG: lyase family protein [Actinomycetota bacterium]|nr:lyase family protein [Actinomycetota bacterium]
MNREGGTIDGLFTRTHERGLVRVEVSSGAWLRAMLAAEAALAGACADAGVLPAEAAAAIESACTDSSRYDEVALGILAAQTGNPVLALVEAIRVAVDDRVVAYVHYGATSQDILDSAAMLVAHRAIGALGIDLGGCAEAAALLAERHRDTPMVARTLLQQAVPTTFGLKAGQWLHGIDVVSAHLKAVQGDLPAQLGGAAGTLEGFPDPGTAWHVVTAYATRLGLVAPSLPWHTLRYPIGALAGALATTAGILGKVALDLVLLAQNEIGELTVPDDGRGGSSTMAHKRNPVAAVAARSAAKRAPGLAATLFATMEQEHERAAGAWQAEWPTLGELLTCVGSAAAWLREALESMDVDESRMASNLAALGSTASAGSTAVLIDRALADHRTSTDTSTDTNNDDRIDIRTHRDADPSALSTNGPEGIS